MKMEFYVILREWRGDMDGDGCSNPVAYTSSKLEAEYFCKKKNTQGVLLERVSNFIDSYYGNKYGSEEKIKYLDPHPRLFVPYTGRIEKYMKFDWNNEVDKKKRQEIMDKMFYPLLKTASSDGIAPACYRNEWFDYSTAIKKLGGE